MEEETVQLVENKYNDVLSFSKKLTKLVINMDTTTILVSLIAVGILAIILGSIKESVINSQVIVVVLISSFIMYIYFKKQYSTKIKDLKTKNRLLKNDSILDELCISKKHRNSELCNKYKGAKKNFYLISNMLLQKYNIE